jgi:hypothetical protein
LRASTHAYLGARPSVAPKRGPAPRILATAVAMLIALLLTSETTVHGKASHDGWPTNDCNWRKKHRPGPGCGVYRSHHRDQDGPISGTERTDELLGGHGHDIIDGGGAGDVIWGDFKPCCQPSGQRDQLRGGWGNDYIYASHGFNDIDSGPGNDVVHAHFGRGGSVDCGSGYDVLYVSHRSKPRYRERNCERTRF